MPTNTIVFNVQDRQARAGFNRLKRDVDELDNEFRDSRSEVERAGDAIDRLGDEARQTATQVDRLGDTWSNTNKRLRDARGRFVGASQGARTFIGSLGGLQGILAGLGIAAAAREVFEFGIASVQAAGRMEGLRRGLEAIEGSNADRRLRDFNEIAKLPGLNTPQIIRYSNSLRSAGATTAEVDAIITTFGQSIVGLGGSAADTSRAMLQLTQAFGENKISQENFSTIKELIPSFNRLTQEVYNTDGSMDDLNKKFQASGQTLGQFLLPVLAKLRQEIPAAPVDSYARSIDTLGEEFEQFKIAVGTELLPIVSATARGLASLFNTMAGGVKVIGDFFDIVDEQHEALLNASESAQEFSVRLADIDTAAGQSTAVNARIQTLHRLRSALRIEQSAVSDSTQEYRRYAERIRDVANELDLLRALRSAGTGDSDNAQLLAQQTAALSRTNASIEDYERRLERVRAVSVGRTNPSIQQLERALERQRSTAAALTREIELLKNGFQDFVAPAAIQEVTNYALEIEKLKATAEDTRRALAESSRGRTFGLNFDTTEALSASNAYYDERIRQAEAALQKEKEGTDEYVRLQARILELGQQRLAAERQLESQRNNIRPNFQAALAASNAYYDERIRQAEAALAKEKEGTDAFNALQVQIFQLGRQRFAAQRQLETELTGVQEQEFKRRSDLIDEASRRRIDAALAARESEIRTFQSISKDASEYASALSTIATVEHRRAALDYTNALIEQGENINEARKQAVNFFKQIDALPSQASIRSLATYNLEIKQLNQEFRLAGDRASRFNSAQETLRRSLATGLLTVTGYRKAIQELKRELEVPPTTTEAFANILTSALQPTIDQFLETYNLDVRIPDPGVQQQQIDDQIAAQARGQQTLTDIRQDALEQGRTFLRRILNDEQREIQRNINASARQYRQFANLVSNTFLDLATGRVQSFQTIAAQFIQQSLRIVARAIIEHQIRLRLSHQLADAQIADINRVAAAEQAASVGGLGGLGNLPGLGNLSGLSGLFSGGGAALGVSALLFPQEIRNLSGGITDTIGNLLSNVASIPDQQFAPQQIFLKIGDNEARDITDLQDALREEERV